MPWSPIFLEDALKTHSRGPEGGNRVLTRGAPGGPERRCPDEDQTDDADCENISPRWVKRDAVHHIDPRQAFRETNDSEGAEDPAGDTTDGDAETQSETAKEEPGEQQQSKAAADFSRSIVEPAGEGA